MTDDTKSEGEPTEGSRLPAPEGGCELPLFVYGALQPDEVGHARIADELVSAWPNARLSGWETRIRDGLPLLTVAEWASATGWLVQLTTKGYERVRDFEPKELYRWQVVDVDVDTTPVRANALVGRSPGVGGAELMPHGWSSALDPVFGFALDTARDLVESLDVAPLLEPGPAESREFWDPFFRLEAAYLLLWTAVERYTTFAYGPSRSPSARISALDADERFRAVVRAAGVEPGQRVVKSDDPGNRIVIRPDGRGAAKYWYQVRSNLSHRGKGAYRDARIVHSAFIDLHNVFRLLLSDAVPRVADRWQVSAVTGRSDFLMNAHPPGIAD